MKSALLVGATLLILPSGAGAERGLTDSFTSTTAIAKYENICLPVIAEQARKYLRSNPEGLHREAQVLAIFAIVRALRCP